MLWPLVLPIEIAFWLIAGIVIATTLLASPLKWNRRKTFLVAASLGIVAFVPSCAAIMSVLDKHRFGVFQCSTFGEVDDFRVERYLPPTARDITLDKYAAGFRARYRIREDELQAYLDDLWARYGDRSTTTRRELQNDPIADPETFNLHFGDLGWPPLAKAKEYQGPVAGNGAGFSIWYSKSEGIAYERAGYW
jgi:hypothetical protein